MRRMFHLRDQNEKHEVSCIRKHRIRDADESRNKTRVRGDADTSDRETDACANHAHDTRDQDTEYAGNAKPGQPVEGAGK